MEETASFGLLKGRKTDKIACISPKRIGPFSQSNQIKNYWKAVLKNRPMFNRILNLLGSATL